MAESPPDEIAFVRLLAACERAVFGSIVLDTKGLGGKRPPVQPFPPEYLTSLRAYLETLTSTIRTLESRHSTHEAPTMHASKARGEQLREFRQRVEFLMEARHVRASELEAASRLEQERQKAEAEAAASMIKRTVSAPMGRRRRTGSSASGMDLSKERSLKQIPEDTAPDAARRRAGSDVVVPPPATTATTAAAADHKPRAASASETEHSTPVHEVTETDVDPVELERRVHKKMETQLAFMSSMLKERASKVLQDLQSDNKVLDTIDGQVATNLGKIESANTQLAESMAASRGSCWTTLLLLVAVMAMFIATFMLIQVKGKVVTPAQEQL